VAVLDILDRVRGARRRARVPERAQDADEGEAMSRFQIFGRIAFSIVVLAYAVKLAVEGQMFEAVVLAALACLIVDHTDHRREKP